jgi:hypothetical protein
MPLISGTIDRDGATVVVLVGVSRNREKRLRAVGLPVPARKPVRVQVDTGSFATAFLSTVFRELEVERFGVIPVRTPSTRPGQPHLADQFDVSLVLVSGMESVILPSVHALAAEDFDGEGSVQGIMGRDVLARCVFTYSGLDSTFGLAFF